MPTTRLMQFSSAGGGEERVGDKGKSSSHPLQGVSSAHFLKLIEERGQTGFWTLDFGTGNMTTSVGLYRLFGIDPSTPLGHEDLLRMMHPDDRPSHHFMYETLLSGHAINREFRIIRPDGTLRWLQNKAEVIVDGKGHLTRAVGVIVDVTEEHSARQSIEDGWHRYKTLVKSIAAMELKMKANGEVVNCDGWYELTGQTEAEASGGGWLEAIHPDDRQLTRSLLSSFAPGDIRAIEYRVRCVDGQYRWFLARTAPIVNPDGTIREWIGTVFEAVLPRADASDLDDQSAISLQAPQIRAARAMLNWTIDDLALKAGVSVSSVSRLEARAGNTVRDHVLQAVRKAFENDGISFTSGLQGTVSIHFQYSRNM